MMGAAMEADYLSQVQSALRAPCAHDQSPCAGCQEGRLAATFRGLLRTHVDALREIRRKVEATAPPGIIVQAVDAAVSAVPRDTPFDAALALLPRAHAALRKTTRPRPAQALIDEIAAFLAVQGIEVEREGSPV